MIETTIQDVLSGYINTKKLLRKRLKELDTEIKHQKNSALRKDLYHLRCIYEKELYEVLCVISEIQDYIKVTNK